MAKKFGHSIAIPILALILPFKAFSLERKNWILTQLATPSLPVVSSDLGFQLGVTTLTFDSFISTQASFFWDTKELEVGAKASGRVFQQMGIGRTAVSNSLKNWTETYSVELARRFISPEGRYGRLGIQYDWFTPQDEQFIHLALDSGVLDSPSESGLLQMAFHLFHPITKGLDTRLLASLDSGSVVWQWSQSKMKLGLQFAWTYHLSQEQEAGAVSLTADKTLSSEHMLFAATPWLEYQSSRLVAKIGTPLRLFLDKEWSEKTMPANAADQRLVVSHPFNFNWADVWLSCTFLL